MKIWILKILQFDKESLIKENYFSLRHSDVKD